MSKRTHLVAVGLVALGYAAASGLWNPFQQTHKDDWKRVFAFEK